MTPDIETPKHTTADAITAPSEGPQPNVPPEGGKRNTVPEGGKRNTVPEGGKRNTQETTHIDRELQAMVARDAVENKRLRMAVLGAALIHAVLLIVTFPQLRAEPDERPRQVSEVYVIQPMRFKPPAPRREEIPKRKTKKIPIPDPTPDEPEPLEVEELQVVEIELPATDADVFGIPDAPAAAQTFGSGDVMQVGGGVTAPEKLIAPQPRYTEDARKSRVQGVVILQAVLDATGSISQVKVLKGLPLGLTDSALETVKSWRYKPATLDGKPVAVYLNLLINFSLQ